MCAAAQLLPASQNFLPQNLQNLIHPKLSYNLLALPQVVQRCNNYSQTTLNRSDNQAHSVLFNTLSPSHLLYIMLAHSIQSNTEIQARIWTKGI